MKANIYPAVVAAFLMLAGSLQADPWKDESGHGRGGPPPWAGKGGEPPDWARGKGVWDGHWKHGYDGPLGYYRDYRAEQWRPHYYAPGPSYSYPPYGGYRYVYPDDYDHYYDYGPSRYYGQGRLNFQWEVWR